MINDSELALQSTTSSSPSPDLCSWSSRQPNDSALLCNNSGDSRVFDDVLQDFKDSLYTYQQPRTIALICFYGIIFLLAVLGNVMVMLVVLCNRGMRSVTNYFLLNLAVADLLVTLVCIPLTVGETIYKVWVYGHFMCKATSYLQGMSIAASVLTIMALSLDRYFVIRFPVKARRVSSTTNARIVLVSIWIIAACIMIPLATIKGLATHTLPYGETIAYCHENWASVAHRRTFDVFLFVFIYVIPGAVVVFCYSSTGCLLLGGDRILNRANSDVRQNQKMLAGRRRLARMLLIIAILFAVSWMPYHAVSLYVDFGTEKEATNSLPVLSFALLLGHSHSAQNHILYLLMNHSFRRGMISLLRCQCQGDITRIDSRQPMSRQATGMKLRRLRESSSREHPNHQPIATNQGARPAGILYANYHVLGKASDPTLTAEHSSGSSDEDKTKESEQDITRVVNGATQAKTHAEITFDVIATPALANINHNAPVVIPLQSVTHNTIARAGERQREGRARQGPGYTV